MNLLRYLEFFVLAGLVLVSAAAAHQRNHVWKSNLSLWGDCVSKSYEKARPYNNRHTSVREAIQGAREERDKH